MLRCRDGSLYTGCTNHLVQRVARHGAGRGAAYTRSRLPVALAWWEPAADRSAALRREAALKRLPRAEKLRLAQAPRRRGRAAVETETRASRAPARARKAAAPARARKAVGVRAVAASGRGRGEGA